MAGSVVHIINDLNGNGGAERLVVELAQRQARFSATVIVWKGANHELLEDKAFAAVTIIAVKLTSPSSIARAWRAMRAADVVHVHLFPSLYFCALLPFRKIYTEHNTWNRRRARRWLRGIERWVYGRYDGVAAISAPVRDHLSEWLAPMAAKIHIVENGVSLDRFVSARDRKPDGLFYIGMVGSFTEKKDQETIVRALQRLPDNVHAVFAGVGERRPIVEELAGALGLRERVHFSGLVRDIPAFLGRLDLYVQSSHWEGFGVAVVEAMASDLPVLVSDVGGLAVVVDNDDYRFAAKNHGQLADRIRELASDDEKYGNATAYARRRAQGFSIDRTVSCYEDLYDLIKSGPLTLTAAGADAGAPRFRRSSRPSQDLS
ncbi:glycosyltransferase [Ensifer adhaerens]|uniref:glycosyltransferase n=1 Tax=Ensifer adhaerens TaxID=106592 RepID=UPI000DC5DAFA|nr:glycosyltransferase [Ensifer adhaerens]RAS04031.1 glycosyltransferase involved in cell wall biosynthesis [Ensifer adhaerens]